MACRFIAKMAQSTLSLQTSQPNNSSRHRFIFMERKTKRRGGNDNGYWGSAALANVLLYGVRCRPKAPWRNFPTGKGVAPLRRQQGRAGGGGRGKGRREGRGRPYAKARVQHALYCYFARSFNNVACVFALTHTIPSPLTKFAADPLHRKFLQSSAKGKAVIAEKIAGDAQPKIATDSVRREGKFPSSMHNY